MNFYTLLKRTIFYRSDVLHHTNKDVYNTLVLMTCLHLLCSMSIKILHNEILKMCTVHSEIYQVTKEEIISIVMK